MPDGWRSQRARCRATRINAHYSFTARAAGARRAALRVCRSTGTVVQHFPIVIEHEANDTWSAWVAGLPGVYAAADSLAKVKRAIREACTAHLDTLGDVGALPRGQADVVVLRYDATEPRRQARVRFVGLGALLGRTTSPAKAAAARRNGQRGGRPRNAVQRPTR